VLGDERGLRGREKFVRSLEQWWDCGMRVSSRDVDMIRRRLHRRSRHHPAPGEGDALRAAWRDGRFAGYVTNVWVRENDDRRLLAAEISSTTRDD
jgi:hypothetical protein